MRTFNARQGMDECAGLEEGKYVLKSELAAAKLENTKLKNLLMESKCNIDPAENVSLLADIEKALTFKGGDS